MTTTESHLSLLDLAPLSLPNYRTRRYHGDDLCLSVSAFTAEDQVRLRELYVYLQQLFAALSPDLPESPLTRLNTLMARHPVDSVVDQVRAFGKGSYAASPSPLMAKTIHDLRGGGLTPLLGQLQLFSLLPPEESRLHALYFLTRDHLKIMRNALTQLDDAKRQEDLQIKLHSTDFIVQKWDGAALQGADRSIRLDVECEQPTAISECCVEFGALDRILYNLINNACRHTVADHIRLVLLPVPDTRGENLRFVLLNSVSSNDLAHLRNQNLGTLFQEGVSSTGSGYGLAIANDFVSNAYGLSDQNKAVQEGYLGATILEDSFVAWFHWPRILED